MTSELFDRYVPPICAGVGLVLVGSANLLLPRRALLVRCAATVAVLGAVAGIVAALGQPGLFASTARLLALALVPCLLFALRPVPDQLAASVAALHQPGARFGLLTIVGAVVAISAFVLFERADRAAADADTAELELMHGRAPCFPSRTFRAATDLGTQIVLHEAFIANEPLDQRPLEDRILRAARLEDQVIRRAAADDVSNCHGWVFSGAKFQITAADVELILSENGYQETRDPHPSDLVLYRNNGSITHSAVVRYVTEGQPVLVEGKWGQFGVFLHPADKCTYGSDYTFYRSARRGHLLAGLQGADRSEGQAPAMPAE